MISDLRLSNISILNEPLGAGFIGRSLGLDHTYMSRSCLVQVMCFATMLCHDVNSPNAPNGAPRHEYCGFKWVGSMITCVKDPFFIKKK